MENRQIAASLDRVGELLADQDGNAFRVRAYHAAADALRALPEPAAEILQREGEKGLQRIEHVGESLARAIAELIRTGHLRTLDRLEGEVCPERVLMNVPGIGPELAHRIHEELDVETLEQLEQAAHDGRLQGVQGLGPRRVEGIRRVLASMLKDQRRRSQVQQPVRPPVEDLLAVDEEYLARAQRDSLPKIAPRRFNPKAEAWLPVMHTERGGFHYTVLFSNTARAHRLDKTHDWVVIFYERGSEEDQCTVVTEHHGALEGLRVVRGREAECRRHYAARGVA
ncbi:MAG: helix-hairpin-helix domain-containing protein [Myxococcales bacterium]|jgi:hypothetical protein